MTVYMVFEPPAADGDPAARVERIVFVADRFSWGAFLLTPLWMLWRRLWLVFIAYVVVVAALTAGLRFAGAGAGASFLIVALIALLVGFEAANLRRWTLLRGGLAAGYGRRRRGWREVGAVIGDDVETAERRFFDAFVAAEAARKAAPAPALRPGPAASAVVGLFPQPGANR